MVCLSFCSCFMVRYWGNNTDAVVLLKWMVSIVCHQVACNVCRPAVRRYERRSTNKFDYKIFDFWRLNWDLAGKKICKQWLGGRFFFLFVRLLFHSSKFAMRANASNIQHIQTTKCIWIMFKRNQFFFVFWLKPVEKLQWFGFFGGQHKRHIFLCYCLG